VTKKTLGKRSTPIQKSKKYTYLLLLLPQNNKIKRKIEKQLYIKEKFDNVPVLLGSERLMLFLILDFDFFLTVHFF